MTRRSFLRSLSALVMVPLGVFTVLARTERRGAAPAPYSSLTWDNIPIPKHPRHFSHSDWIAYQERKAKRA